MKKFPNKELLILLAFGLSILNIAKAVNFPLTHDEALSFLIFNGQPFWEGTANNHHLNTILMKVSASFFGHSEWALRLPNILAHQFYLLFSIILALRFTKPVSQIGCFVLLNFNLFSFDFFSLARGYGMGLGFILISLYFFLVAAERPKDKFFVLSIYLSLIAGALAVYANFAFLNLFIPLWIVCLATIIIDSSPLKLSIKSDRLVHFAPLFSGGAGVIVWVARALFELNSKNQLYFGGTDNLVNDTIKSLIEASLYDPSVSNLTVQILTIAFLFLTSAFFVVSIYLFLKNRALLTFHWLVILLTGVLLLPVLQNFLFEVRYPLERTALYIIPLFSILLAHLLNFLNTTDDPILISKMGFVFSALISILMMSYFFTNFSFNKCYSWGYDVANKAAIRTIATQRESFFPDETISVGINWIFEPSLNYYRQVYNYSWITPFTRDGIRIGEDHFIYTYKNELTFPIQGYELIQTFPQTDTVLLRKTAQ